MESSLAEKDFGCPGGHKVEYESAVCPCSKGVQQHPGLYWEEHYQQVKEGGQLW